MPVAEASSAPPETAETPEEALALARAAHGQPERARIFARLG